jgi:diguanylate cyclase (GGDEF)-like protein
VNHIRRTIGVAVATLALLPAGAAAASADVAATVGDVAADAADLLAQERDLVRASDPSSGASRPELNAARSQLRDIDAANFASLRELRRLGVDITEAMRVTMSELLPVTLQAIASEAPTQPPPMSAYDAAIDDLRRIAETPSAFIGTPSESENPTVGLLAVAALALLALGAAALGNTLRQRPSGADLEAMAWSDGLTGVANRRRLDHDIEARQELGEQTAVIMIDVDHFKVVNDSFGHRQGDEVLRRLGTAISESVRYDDVVYRYGGEEFCVLLPGATAGEAREVGQRIIAAAHSIDLPNGTNVTVSLGIADAPTGDVSSAMSAADQALFSAKEQGRDRAIFASADQTLTSV